MAEVALAVFDCPACGAHVRWVQAPETTCAACGAAVSVPHEQRAARQLESEHEALSREAQAIAERIGHEPNPAFQLLTLFESSAAFALLLPAVVIAAVFVSAALVRKLGPWLGPRAVEDDRYVVFGSFVVTVAFWGGGLILATYAGKRLAGLRELQAGLSAKPPARAGGQAACRNCGAALDIAAGALAVRCRYCAAENLVAVPARWLTRARHAQGKLSDSLVVAAQAWDAELMRLARSARVRFFGVLLVGGPIVGLVGAIVLGSPPTKQETPWQKESRTPRLIVDPALVKSEHDAYAPLLSPLSCEAPAKPRSFKFPDIACGPDGCTAPWYVALVAGDRVRLSSSEAGDSLVLFYPFAGGPPFPKGGRGELLQKGTLAAGSDVELKAPEDGWYLILFHTSAAVKGQRYDLCAELSR